MAEYDPQLRSCFVQLRENLGEALADPHSLADFTRHADQIVTVFETGCIPVSQDSLAGFTKTFALACTQAPEQVLEDREGRLMGVAGAACVLALAAPVSCAVIARDNIYRSGFWDRYFNTEHGDPAFRMGQAAQAEEILKGIFASMPDVPMSAESLAGAVLGMVFANRLVAVDIVALDAMTLAARGLALGSKPQRMLSDP